MKRKLAVLLTLALTATLFGGCGSDSKTETSGGSTTGKSAALSKDLSTEKMFLLTHLTKS